MSFPDSAHTNAAPPPIGGVRPAAADLAAFIHASPTPFHVVETTAARLTAAGFVEQRAGQPWLAIPDAGYVRYGGSIVAWRVPQGPFGRFRVIGAHTDSPNLRVKPRPDTTSEGVGQLGVEVYGGVLLNSWLDRDLAIAGRVICRDGGQSRERLFSLDRPIMRIPQLAIHLDRDVNERGLVLNKQVHLAPMWGTAGPNHPTFRGFLAELTAVAPEDIVAWDAMLHDTSPPAFLGLGGEYLSAPRLDNQLSCHAALVALIAASCKEDALVVALFDHEEVGSTSDRGADGAFLGSILERLSLARGIDRAAHLALLARSHAISADGAHATHPNYPERHEPAHRVALNGGPVIKVNTSMRYATDAASAAPFLAACERAGAPYQWFVTRTDLACGSTIGPLTAAQLGIATVDVGVAQLAMHSARELCGSDDPGTFVSVLGAYLS